jgi:hypothetical protein
MKFAIRLLLISALAMGPVGCNRSNAPDEPVSANSDRTYSDRPVDRPVTRDRESARDTRQAYRPPERDRRDQVRPADRENRPIEAERPIDRPVQRARTIETAPSGTAVTVTLSDSLSTDNNKEGDQFTAHLSQPIIVAGKVLAEKGDRVTGHIKVLEEPGRVKGRARMELVLDELQTGKNTYKVSTEPFIAVASDNHERDAAEIAGGAAVGAVIGAVTGGKKGAAIGAVIGGGTGTTAVLLTKGKQLKLEPETKVNFVLSRDLDLPVIRNTNT